VELIKFAEQNGNRAAEREFFVNDTHILYWLKQKKGCAKQNAAFRGPQKGKKCFELEEKLFKYEETRNNGSVVTNEMLLL
jgi:hypothetical protein